MQLTTTSTVRSLRPRRRLGFPADLSRGFYLFAPERMTFISASGNDGCGWRTHRFVAFDGRLIKVRLPQTIRLFIWPAGKGPRPVDSVASRGTIWGQMPSASLHSLSSAELHRFYELWERYGRLNSLQS